MSQVHTLFIINYYVLEGCFKFMLVRPCACAYACPAKISIS